MPYSLNQCKKDMLLIWGYLKDNPDCNNKCQAINNLPISMQRKIRLLNLQHQCPCCEYDEVHSIYENHKLKTCEACPIWAGYHCNKGEFGIWDNTENIQERQAAAEAIYNLALKIGDKS